MTISRFNQISTLRGDYARNAPRSVLGTERRRRLARNAVTGAAPLQIAASGDVALSESAATTFADPGRLGDARLTVIAIGSPAFCDAVAEAAEHRSRRLVARFGAVRGQALSEDRMLPACHEIVLEPSAFEQLGGFDPELLGHVDRVLIWNRPTFAGGSVAANPFDPVLPDPSRFVKRFVDVVASSTLSVLLAPAMIIIGVAVRVDSRGPALFTQTRVGIDGRRFRLYKFRTMHVDNDDSEHQAYVAALIKGDAAKQGTAFKLAADSRITRVGRLLRKTSLDEIPQLWNVVRGDMSLVGPRPALPREVVLYDHTAWQRLRVKPGMTGLWQVSGRSELDFTEMVELDVRYWRDWSLMLEARILLRTPRAVLSARGAK